jgi:hypothetical protein
MGALVPPVLVALDACRAIRGVLGLNPFTVTVRVRTWTGARPGLGTKTDKTTTLTVGVPPLGPQPCTVREVTNQEIITSGGLYRARDLKIGPLTPSYMAGILPAGGWGDGTVDAPVQGSAAEVFWNVAGPGMPAGGAWCKKIRESVTALHYEVFVRATGEQK